MAITATQAIGFKPGIEGDRDGDGIVDPADTIASTPGDTLRVTVTIDNSVGAAATNVQLTGAYNGLTIGNVNVSALPFDDAYNVVGNTTFTVDAANGLLNGPTALHATFGPDAEFLGATFGTGAGQTRITTTGTIDTAGGSVVLNADGSFVYTPDAGFTGTDTFTYTLTDAGLDGDFSTAGDNLVSSAATVTFNVEDLVWFIDNTGGGTGGTGTQANPFKTIADFNAVNDGVAVANNHPDIGDIIYLREGTGTYTESDGINLLNNQTLIGQGENLVVNHSLQGNVTVETGTAGDTPVIVVNGAGNQGIQLAQGNTIRGLDVGMNNASAVGIADGGGTVGNLTISNVGVGVGSSVGSGIDIDQGGTLNVQLDSVTSTGAARGIDLGTTTGLAGTGAGFTVSGATTINDAIGDGIAIGQSSLNATFTGQVTIINDASGGRGVVLGVAVGGANTGIYSFNGGFDIATTSEAGLVAQSSGTLNIQGAGNTITSTTGFIHNLSNITIGAGGITFDTLQTGTTSVSGLMISNVDGGTYNGGAVSIAGTGAGGLPPSPGISISGGSSSSLNFSSVTINSTGNSGAGISITGEAGDGVITFGTVNINNTAAAGIAITGNTNAVNINGGSIGATNDPTGNAVDIDDGAGNILIAASITRNTAGADVVEITNRDGGTITFTGAISASGGSGGIDIDGNSGGTVINFNGQTTLNTGTGIGVDLTNNGGATINFNAGGTGLDITTTTGIGFNATGGGTVNVTDADGGGAQGNSVTSAGGTALNVVGTTIGGNGLNFQSISANGGSSGIVLNNTGSSGGLTVTGTGTNNSGGTIQNTTSHGISLTSTLNPTFDELLIQNTTRSGIWGTDVTNFTLTDSTITNSGITAGNAVVGQIGDSNIAFNNNPAGTTNNLDGTVTITGNDLSRGYYHGVQIYNTAGTIDNATISTNTYTSSTVAAAAQGQGIHLVAFGNATSVANITRATISGNTITNIPVGVGIEVQGGNSNASGPGGTVGQQGSTTNVIRITNNVVDGVSGAVGSEGILASVQGGNAGSRSQANFIIDDNDVIDRLGHGISNSTFGNSTMTSRITNNTSPPTTPASRSARRALAGDLGSSPRRAKRRS